MSWWVSLNKKGIPVEVDSFREGGTYCMFGASEADLNVTYNYGKHFDFNSLHRKKAKTTIKVLEDKIKEFGTKKEKDYWQPTKGNVGYALNILLTWAKQYPEARWRVN